MIRGIPLNIIVNNGGQYYINKRRIEIFYWFTDCRRAGGLSCDKMQLKLRWKKY